MNIWRCTMNVWADRNFQYSSNTITNDRPPLSDKDRFQFDQSKNGVKPEILSALSKDSIISFAIDNLSSIGSIQSAEANNNVVKSKDEQIAELRTKRISLLKADVLRSGDVFSKEFIDAVKNSKYTYAQGDEFGTGEPKSSYGYNDGLGNIQIHAGNTDENGRFILPELVNTFIHETLHTVFPNNSEGTIREKTIPEVNNFNNKWGAKWQ